MSSQKAHAPTPMTVMRRRVAVVSVSFISQILRYVVFTASQVISETIISKNAGFWQKCFPLSAPEKLQGCSTTAMSFLKTHLLVPVGVGIASMCNSPIRGDTCKPEEDPSLSRNEAGIFQTSGLSQIIFSSLRQYPRLIHSTNPTVCFPNIATHLNI